MAIAEQNYIGDGSTSIFPFAFPYISASDVKATVDTTPVTITLATASSVQFPSAPGAGAKVRIYRETPAGNIAATFFPGSAIRAQDLNNGFKQLLYTLQEVVERSVLKIDTVLVGALNMSGFKVTNLGTPSVSTDAATKGYIDAQVANIEFLANTANSLNNDGYPELRRVIGNSEGLTSNAWHTETGRGGYFHPNSGTSEGQFAILRGVAGALRVSKDNRFGWLLQHLTRSLIKTIYRGVEAPADPTTINNENLWIPHWLWNAKGDFISEEIRYDYTPTFVNGQANIPVSENGHLVRQVFRCVSTNAVLEWENPTLVVDLLAGTNYPIANTTTSATGTLVQLVNTSFNGPAKVFYSTYTGPVIGKNQPYEAWPCWRQLDMGESACAIDSMHWCLEAYEKIFEQTFDPNYDRYYKATLESCKYVLAINDDTYWFAPTKTRVFASYPYSAYINRLYNKLTRTNSGNMYLDLPADATGGAEITINRSVPVGAPIETLQTGQDIKVKIKGSAAVPILFWVDTDTSGFNANNRYYCGRTLTPPAGSFGQGAFEEFTLIRTDFLRASDGTTPFPGGTTAIKRVGFTYNDSAAVKIELKEAIKDVDTGYLYCPGAQPFTANTMYNKLIDWRGPIYVGYQSPWTWHRLGDTTARNNCIDLIEAAQNDYNSVRGVLGPFSPVFYLPRKDNEQYGPANTFGWTGPDPNTFWGGFQYRVTAQLGKLRMETTNAKADTILSNFINWLEGAWPTATPPGPPPTTFPSNAAAYVQYSSEVYMTALAGLTALYMKKQSIGNSTKVNTVLSKAIAKLDYDYTQNEGTNYRGSFMANVSESDRFYYAFWHGEAMHFLAEVLTYLTSGDIVALGSTEARLKTMLYNSGGWLERNLR